MRPAPRLAAGVAAFALPLAFAACGGDSGAPAAQGEPSAAMSSAEGAHEVQAFDVWAQGRPVFGIYVPSEGPRPERGQPRPPAVYTVEGGKALAQDSLTDFLFLNLEEHYDPAAVEAIAQGLEQGGGQDKLLLVRIPPIGDEGVDSTRARVKYILDAGADGVVIPHVQDVEQAKAAISFFQDAGADVWTPDHRQGKVVAMLMLEDPAAVAQAAEVADLPGFSILACGIGSLTQALKGDRQAAEQGNQKVLAEAKRTGHPDMITADAQSITPRVQQGFLALLMQGPTADSTIQIGRAASGR